MDNEILVSICMPVYNAGTFIAKTLDTVVNQTIQNKQVVIVDDGSKDNTKDIIREYMDQYSFIKYVYQENQGVSVARQTAVNHADGKYIGFVDADDTIENTMYEFMVNEAEKNGYDIVECRADRNGSLYNTYPPKTDFGINVFLSYCENYDLMRPLWLRVYRRELFTSNTFPKERINNEDVFVTPCLLVKANKYCVLPMDCVFYHYNDVNENSVTRLLHEKRQDRYKKKLLFSKVPNHFQTILPNEFMKYKDTDNFKILCGRLDSESFFDESNDRSYEESINDLMLYTDKTRKEIESDILKFLKWAKAKGYYFALIFGLKKLWKIKQKKKNRK